MSLPWDEDAWHKLPPDTSLSSLLPLMATDIMFHCLVVLSAGCETGTKPQRCTGWDVPAGGGLPGCYLFDVCGPISHLALLQSCLHPVSSLLTLPCVLVFLSSLWRPVVVAELMHVLPLVQFMPTPWHTEWITPPRNGSSVCWTVCCLFKCSFLMSSS